MMDIGQIQRLAFSLVAGLTQFDPQRIVQEKQEDGAALREAGEAIAAIGAAIEETAADGIVDGGEAAALRQKGEAALAKLRAVGAEIIDQETEGTE